MRLTILCGSFMLLAMVNGGVVKERSETTAKEEEYVNSVPVKSASATCSSEETSNEEYDPYNYAPSYPYQYYGYPPVNPMHYRQYPQYYNPQKASKEPSKRTPAYQGGPPQYPPQLPSYYPQVPPYQPQYPQYPPPASRYGPPYYRPGVNNPQANGGDDVGDEYCNK